MHLPISSWTHVDLFSTRGCNPVLSYFFCCSNAAALAVGFLQLGSCMPLTCFVILRTAFVSITTSFSRLILYCLCCGIGRPSEEPWLRALTHTYTHRSFRLKSPYVWLAVSSSRAPPRGSERSALRLLGGVCLSLASSLAGCPVIPALGCVQGSNWVDYLALSC